MSGDTYEEKVASEECRRMRAVSGRVDDFRPLVAFLYELVRDLVPTGRLEDKLDRIAANAEEDEDGERGPFQFTNGWLARWAQDAAERLEEPAAGNPGTHDVDVRRRLETMRQAAIVVRRGNQSSASEALAVLERELDELLGDEDTGSPGPRSDVVVLEHGTTSFVVPWRSIAELLARRLMERETPPRADYRPRWGSFFSTAHVEQAIASPELEVSLHPRGEPFDELVVVVEFPPIGPSTPQAAMVGELADELARQRDDEPAHDGRPL